MDIEGAEYNLLPCLAQFKDAGGAKFDGFVKQNICVFRDVRSTKKHDELILNLRNLK